MRKTILALVVVIISVVGILDAAYITYEKALGQTPPCSSAFKCGEVLSSPYASIGPMPLSVAGLGFYITFFVLGCWYVLNLDIDETHVARRVRRAMWILGTAGLLFSGYLVFLMAIVIQAWCFYCLLSALNCVLLFCTSTALNVVRSEKSEDAVHV